MKHTTLMQAVELISTAFFHGANQDEPEVEVIGKVTEAELERMRANQDELNAEKARIGGMLKTFMEDEMKAMKERTQAFAQELNENEAPKVEALADKGIKELDEILYSFADDIDDLKLDLATGEVTREVRVNADESEN